MTIPAPDASLYTDFKGISDLKRDAQARDPKALREAARQFESLFTRMMLKSMREASFGDPHVGQRPAGFLSGHVRRPVRRRDVERPRAWPGGHAGAAADARRPRTADGGSGGGSRRLRPSSPTVCSTPTLQRSSTTPSEALEMVEDIPSRAFRRRSHSRTSAQLRMREPSTNEFSGSPEEFVRGLWPAAEAAGRELGVDPRHILAQAALETGWGRAVPSACDRAVEQQLLRHQARLELERRDRFRAHAGVRERPARRRGAITSARTIRRRHASTIMSHCCKNNPRYAAALNTGDERSRLRSRSAERRLRHRSGLRAQDRRDCTESAGIESIAQVR